MSSLSSLVSFKTAPKGKFLPALRVARFPLVIGAIDCTHVKIQSPGGEDAERFPVLHNICVEEKDGDPPIELDFENVGADELPHSRKNNLWFDSVEKSERSQFVQFALSWELGIVEREALARPTKLCTWEFFIRMVLQSIGLPAMSLHIEHTHPKIKKKIKTENRNTPNQLKLASSHSKFWHTAKENGTRGKHAHVRKKTDNTLSEVLWPEETGTSVGCTVSGAREVEDPDTDIKLCLGITKNFLPARYSTYCGRGASVASGLSTILTLWGSHEVTAPTSDWHLAVASGDCCKLCGTSIPVRSPKPFLPSSNGALCIGSADSSREMRCSLGNDLPAEELMDLGSFIGLRSGGGKTLAVEEPLTACTPSSQFYGQTNAI
ncbi:hypothetical protein HUJ05_002013 [Dendroctonus ponderosae]|nr:hypothetical protein HUJ05_002013 [Dendroctonus ponderosae]